MQGDDTDAHQAAAEPEEAQVQPRPRSGSRAGTPLMEASDPARKRGGEWQLPVMSLTPEMYCTHWMRRASGM